MMNFDFDVAKFSNSFMPIALRKTKFMALISAFLKPVKTLFSEFNSFVSEKRDEYKYNGRTISLRNLLINQFGAGIIIENQLTNGDPYLLSATGDAFNDQLAHSGNLLNPQVGISGSAVLDGVDFIVKVPAVLIANLDQVRGLVQKYKVAGITFSVIEI